MYVMITHIFETFEIKLNYNGTPLVRPPLLHKIKWPFKRGGLVRGKNQYIYVKIYIVKWPFQRGWPLFRVAPQKGFHCNCITLP